MAVNKDPILKRCRSLQIDPSHMGIFKESKRTSQTNNFRKMSDYGLQLREKQRAKFIYGILTAWILITIIKFVIFNQFCYIVRLIDCIKIYIQ